MWISRYYDTDICIKCDLEYNCRECLVHVSEDGSRKWMSFITVAIIVSISLGIVSTVASFQQAGTSSITANAGSINLGVGQAGQKNYTFDLGNQWYPGKSDTKSLAVSNSGNLPMKYSVSSPLITNDLLAQIDVIARINGSVVYQGKMNAIVIPLRNLAANSSENIDFSLTWPYVEANRLTDYGLQGKTVSNILVFTASN